VRELKKKVNKLDKENARLRDELENDRVLTSQPKHSGSATDDDSNLEELSVRGLEKQVEDLKHTVSTIKKASFFSNEFEIHLNSSCRKIADCGKEMEDVSVYSYISLRRDFLTSPKLRKRSLEEEVDNCRQKRRQMGDRPSISYAKGANTLLPYDRHGMTPILAAPNIFRPHAGLDHF
jgi:hypothetical protein